ncbi:MAG TPA: ABC transporter permease/substrate-binding protein [Vicinamibacterales bacterium]|nr:ABC transporter permease/substrate-binding protein [Vicinamibacterales bacterium]
MTALVSFWLAHAGELALLVRQHVVLVLISTAAAVVVGVPAGILAARRPHAGRLVLVLANALQTVPSLALLGFLLPLPVVGGLGPRTALLTLSLYAVLPIIRMTVTGIRSVDAAVVEAGVAMGMTPRQLLWLVQLPLALPSIVAGIRVATVIGVGTTTIAAAIGAGGLGEYIFRGLSMVDATTILAGAVPAAAMALVADGLLAWLEQRVRTSPVAPRTALRVAAASAVLVALLITGLSARRSQDRVTVGSKNFTEQVILGEMVAQAIEAEGGVRVDRKLNLGGTFVADRGVRTGELDVYVEYTGTAVTAVFHEGVPHDSTLALERARALYARQGLTVAAPLGFNNTFAVLVRSEDARALGLTTIEDLRAVAGRWTPGFGYEFLQREDGYDGLRRTYDLTFGSPPRGMDLSLIYQALSEKQVDVIAGDATSALIDAFHLVALDDNRHYFPPYDAVPVVRTATLLRRPEVGRALARLAGRISDRDMRALNAAVDVQHQDVAAAVRAFLALHPRK